MRKLIRRLWSGDMPLVRAFWDVAVIGGLLLNASTSIAAFALFTTELSAWVGVAVFLLPLPYNLLAVVAVWRSAARYPGPRHWATAARIAVLLWIATVTLV